MKLKISGPLDNLRFYCSGQIIRAFMVHKWMLSLLEAGIEHFIKLNYFKINL